MSRFSKISVICSAVALILMDLWIVVQVVGTSGANAFNQIMWNMIPCGLLIGTTSLCTTFNVAAKKPLAVISSIFFGLTTVIRVFAISLLIYDRSANPNLEPMSTTDYTALAELAGYGLLMVAAIFLMIYILKGKMKKVTVILASASFVPIIISWFVNVYLLISSILDYDGSISQIFTEFLSGGLLWSIVLMVAYMLIFAVHTSVFEKETER
ncbi:MAG: hypothetical protein U0L55_00775 [Acutalibacteraceae bacterium]|nr:hypothetical protein [Acutalibacteraceae bacterium]